MVEYKKYITQFQIKSGFIGKEKIQEYLDKYSLINTIFSSGPTIPYLLDLTTLTYPLMCDSAEKILGIKAAEFMKNGIKAYVENIHPDDRDIFHYRIIPDFQRIRCSRPLKQITRLRFTFDYRFKKPNNEYIHCLEQLIILETDQYKNPLLNFGTVTDISDYKRDNNMLGTVSLLNDKNEYETIYSKNYTSESAIIYTNREMDIIRLLAKGLSSKAIADKISISSHTVDKHRRNMLKKANMNNTQELVYDALKQGWL